MPNLRWEIWRTGEFGNSPSEVSLTAHYEENDRLALVVKVSRSDVLLYLVAVNPFSLTPGEALGIAEFMRHALEDRSSLFDKRNQLLSLFSREDRADLPLNDRKEPSLNIEDGLS